GCPGRRLRDFTPPRPAAADGAPQAVASAGLPSAVVQASGEDISVRAGALEIADVNRIQEALGEVGGEVTKKRDEFIGPSLGDELRRNAVIALAVALAGQLAYLAIRFRWTFGTAAVSALVVDVSVVVGL